MELSSEKKHLRLNIFQGMAERKEEVVHMQGDKICNFTLFFKNSNFPKALVQQWSDGWLLTPDLYLLWFVFILFAKLAGFSPFTPWKLLLCTEL